MQTTPVSSLNYEKLAHKAANETLSISVGVKMLSTIPESKLTPQQIRAMKILETSSSRLVDLIEGMQSIVLASEGANA